MKSLINLNKLRAHRGSTLAEVYLYGKVLYLLLVEQGMRTTFGHAWGGLDGERAGTSWRLYKLLKARLDALLIAPWAWRPEAVPACFHVLMERPRKRKLQHLPCRVVELRYTLNALPKAASSRRDECWSTDRLAPMARPPRTAQGGVLLEHGGDSTIRQMPHGSPTQARSLSYSLYK